MLVELWQFLVADGLIFPDFRVDCFHINCNNRLYWRAFLLAALTERKREKGEKYLYPSIKLFWHPYRQHQKLKLGQEMY